MLGYPFSPHYCTHSLSISVSMCLCFSPSLFLFVSIFLSFASFSSATCISALPSLWPSLSSFFATGCAEPHGVPASSSPLSPVPVPAPALRGVSLLALTPFLAELDGSSDPQGRGNIWVPPVPRTNWEENPGFRVSQLLSMQVDVNEKLSEFPARAETWPQGLGDRATSSVGQV